MLVTCQAHAHVRADEEIRGLEVQMQNGGILWEGRNGQWFKFLEDYVILHWQGNLRPAIQEGTCALDRCTRPHLLLEIICGTQRHFMQRSEPGIKSNHLTWQCRKAIPSATSAPINKRLVQGIGGFLRFKML